MIFFKACKVKGTFSLVLPGKSLEVLLFFSSVVSFTFMISETRVTAVYEQNESLTPMLHSNDFNSDQSLKDRAVKQQRPAVCTIAVRVRP